MHELLSSYLHCRIRRSTWDRLLLLQDGVLSEVLRQLLKQDPIHPVLDEIHYPGLDRRLSQVIRVVENCMKQTKDRQVIIDS